MAKLANAGRSADPEPSRHDAETLIELTWQQATRRKWLAGRKLYGARWSGAHPLAELFGEYADAVNYGRESVAWGVDPEKALDWQIRTVELLEDVQAEWRKLGGARGQGEDRSPSTGPPSAPESKPES